jgi:hypothetical protein
LALSVCREVAGCPESSARRGSAPTLGTQDITRDHSRPTSTRLPRRAHSVASAHRRGQRNAASAPCSGRSCRRCARTRLARHRLVSVFGASAIPLLALHHEPYLAFPPRPRKHHHGHVFPRRKNPHRYYRSVLRSWSRRCTPRFARKRLEEPFSCLPCLRSSRGCCHVG